jgi:hypothetical protein
MSDLTVIYYTNNQEKPAFEERIKRTLRHTIKPFRIPLISVSQKPINFGINVCVGDVGVSGQNALRQFQIGAKEAKTKFVCTAEADFLYPKEYFCFVPERENVAYRQLPMYVLFALRGKVRVYCPKLSGSFGAIVVGRDAIIRTLDKVLDGFGMWGEADESDHKLPNVFRIMKRSSFVTSIPSISFKTDNCMHRKSPYNKRLVTRDLPYWGNGTELVKRYL